LRAFAQATPPPDTGAPPAAAPAMPQTLAQATPPPDTGAPPAPPAPPPAAAPPAAAPPAAAPAAPAAPAKTWKELITMEGLVDAYYMYNFTGDTAPFHTQTTPQGAPAFTRSFDLNSNSFTLNYAKLAVGMAPDPVGFRIDLGYGATGMLINGAAPGTNGQPTTAIQFGANQASAFLIEQAFATLALGPLTLDAGKFTTTAGAEVIEANKNWNYSRSILFGYIPLVHTGLRGTYKVSDALTIQGSVVNGWNDLGFEGYPVSGKTLGVSINYTAPSATNVILTGYFGPELLAGTSTSWRNLIDLVVAQTIGNLGLNLNFDWINQNNFAPYDNYVGVAVMGHYPVNDHFVLSLRGEWARPTFAPSATTPLQKWNLYEGTLTGAIPFGTHMEVRLELRGDGASGDNNVMDFNGGTSKGVFTGTAAFLAWF
jgi:hypothetical protein